MSTASGPELQRVSRRLGHEGHTVHLVADHPADPGDVAAHRGSCTIGGLAGEHGVGEPVDRHHRVAVDEQDRQQSALARPTDRHLLPSRMTVSVPNARSSIIVRSSVRPYTSDYHSDRTVLQFGGNCSRPVVVERERTSGGSKGENHVVPAGHRSSIRQPAGGQYGEAGSGIDRHVAADNPYPT